MIESEEATLALARQTPNLSAHEMGKRAHVSRSRTLVEFAEVAGRQCPTRKDNDMPSLEMIPAARRRALPAHPTGPERTVLGISQHNLKVCFLSYFKIRNGIQDPAKYAYYEPLNLPTHPPPRLVNLSQHRYPLPRVSLCQIRMDQRGTQQRYYVHSMSQPLAKRVKTEAL